MNTIERYPLDEPHLEALRWACAMPSDLHGHALSMYERGTLALANSEACALRALSSPASAASLVRDLLARAGWHVYAIEDDPGDSLRLPCLSIGDWNERILWELWEHAGADPPDDTGDVLMSQAPRVISALASLAPGDKEGAMRALMEVGR